MRCTVKAVARFGVWHRRAVWRGRRFRASLAMGDAAQDASEREQLAQSAPAKAVPGASQDAPRTPTTSRPAPPAEPEPYECCGNGCDNCVWTVYFEKLAEYERLKQLEEERQEHGRH